MIELNVVMKRTTELTDQELNSLIALKQQHWGYTDEEQRRWFSENIMTDDYHLQIYRGGVLLAYLNIVHVDITINNQDLVGLLGIGNVCVNNNYGRVGMGSILMSVANSFIKKERSCGLLLCHGELTEFYKKSEWEICVSTAVLVNDKPFAETLMLYDPFMIVPEQVNQIIIHRNF